MITAAKRGVTALTEKHLAQLGRIPAGRLRELAAIEMEYLSVPPERAGEYVDAVLRSLLPVSLRKALESIPAADVAVEAADNVIKVTARLPASCRQRPSAFADKEMRAE